MTATKTLTRQNPKSGRPEIKGYCGARGCKRNIHKIWLDAKWIGLIEGDRRQHDASFHDGPAVVR